MGSAEILKHQISALRPDKSDDKSFPSGHTAVAFASARYLDKRYSGQVSPYLLYGAAGLTALARVQADKHYWKDTIAGGALGYAWVTCMITAALSAIFIRDFQLPNAMGYTPIHLLIPLTFFSLYRAFVYLLQGNIQGHRKTMQWLYVSACLVAGAFTLVPGRYLGNLIWSN